MGSLFNIYLYQPILSVLIFIYENLSFHDLGLAIIILTILVRVVLFPLFYKSAKDQSLMQRLQPKIKKIQDDHRHDKEKQTQALLALYKEHKFNPFSGIFLLLIQLPILIALYQVFLKELNQSVFTSPYFFGFINLSQKSLAMAVLAALLQYYQAKLALAPNKEGESKNQPNPMASMGKTMVYMGPIITLLILSNLPSALGFYWSISTAFSLAQQVYINKKLKKISNF